MTTDLTATASPTPTASPMPTAAHTPSVTASPTPTAGRPQRRAGLARAGRAVRGLRLSLWIPTVLALGVVTVLWTLVAASNPYVLPELPAVGESLIAQPGLFLANAWSTLQIALLGLLWGFGAGFVVAVAVSEVPVLRRAIMPLATVLNVTPVVALAPGLVVAFGFGMTPKVIVTAIITFFPVLVNVTTGLRSVQVPVLHVFSTLHASRLEVLLRLRVPSALPYILASLRVTLPLSLVGAVVAEFVAAGSSAGLGTMIKNSAANSQLPQMYAAITCLALMGVLMLVLITTAERRLLFWHESQQRTSS